MAQRWDIHFDYVVRLDEEIKIGLTRAEEIKASISNIPLPPLVAKELNRINIVRQIKGTTGIEGNTLSEEEVAKAFDRFQEGGEVEDGSVEALEVENAIKVQNFIKRWSVENRTDHPNITQRDIKDLHILTTQGIPSSFNQPGAYRTQQVRAGEYQAPEPIVVPELMERLIETINDPKLIIMGPVIRAMVAHFYLVTIHPFADGNGRTSRALEALILYCSRYNARGFYSLANYFYRNRDRYIQALQDARFTHNGDLTEFIRFSVNGLVAEMYDVRDEVNRFLRRVIFENYLDTAVSSKVITPRQHGILYFLLRGEPRIHVEQARDRSHPMIRALYADIKSERTIMRDLENLEENHLIVIEDGWIRANIDLMTEYEG